MKILFLHGWQSTPGGRKPAYLRRHGHEVLAPALPPDDFPAAVHIAQAVRDWHRPDVVVGSSRGGAVAMNIDSGDTPLVLLCPAWKRWGSADRVKPGTVILHAPADEVIPFADSEELIVRSGMAHSSLIEVGTEHRLADEASLAAMLSAAEAAASPAARTGPGIAALPASHALPPLRHEAGVPHSFGVGIPLVLLAMFALLFAVLRAMGAPPRAFLIIGLFVAIVTLGQMLLYQGDRPRRASIVAGAVFGGVLAFVNGAFFEGRLPFAPFDPFAGVIGGMFYGYLVGVFVAGPFLWIGRSWDRPRKAKGDPIADDADPFGDATSDR